MPNRPAQCLFQLCFAAAATIFSLPCAAQSLPTSAGETLSGKRIVLADSVKGHTAVLVAGFSREGGDGTGAWIKQLRADNAFAAATIYQVAMLAGAPGLMRGMIRNGMKKGTSPAEQNFSVVLTEDQKLWESFFGVTTDRDPYVVLLDTSGKILWHGHGAAANLEPLVRAALHYLLSFSLHQKQRAPMRRQLNVERLRLGQVLLVPYIEYCIGLIFEMEDLPGKIGL